MYAIKLHNYLYDLVIFSLKQNVLSDWFYTIGTSMDFLFFVLKRQKK